MNALERRVDRLENPSRGPFDGLAEALDYWMTKPGEPPRVSTPEEAARSAAYEAELLDKQARGLRLRADEDLFLAFATPRCAP